MNTCSFTKEDIIKLIKDNDSNITFVKPQPTSSSQVWSNFTHVYYKNVQQKFVSCDVCKEILSHISSNGTSSMTKHQKSCTKIMSFNNEHKKINEYFNSTKSQSVPRKIKERITSACTEFAILDNRPFHMFGGGGFTNFSQIIFDAGKILHNMSNINIGDLLPNPRTVSKNINSSSWYMFSYFHIFLD
jgi:Hermes transposase DNA-binding domain